MSSKMHKLLSQGEEDARETLQNYKEKVEKAKKKLRSKIYVLIGLSFILSVALFFIFFALMK
jgi:type VI protein secretion system component VasF